MNEELNRVRITGSYKRLSPKSAIFWGTIIILLGLTVILLELGIIPVETSEIHTPGWVIICGGLLFVLGGVAIINGYVFSKNGVLNINPIQNFLGIAMVGLMMIITGWVAFGPGERNFTTNSSLSQNGQISGGTGRIIFGIGFILLLIFFIYGIKNALKKRINQ